MWPFLPFIYCIGLFWKGIGSSEQHGWISSVRISQQVAHIRSDPAPTAPKGTHCWLELGQEWRWLCFWMIILKKVQNLHTSSWWEVSKWRERSSPAATMVSAGCGQEVLQAENRCPLQPKRDPWWSRLSSDSLSGLVLEQLPAPYSHVGAVLEELWPKWDEFGKDGTLWCGPM